MKNRYEVRGDTTVIYINCKGETIEVLVSTSDLNLINSFPNTWYGEWNNRRKTVIVVGNLPWGGKKTRKRMLLSRWIMKPSENLVVDHMNHNTLDNRRSNLRILTNSENLQNMFRLDKNGKLRGVFKRKDKENTWMAYLTINKKRIYLGQFNSEDDANEAVIQKRRKFMPYCKENFEGKAE